MIKRVLDESEIGAEGYGSETPLSQRHRLDEERQADPLRAECVDFGEYLNCNVSVLPCPGEKKS